MAKAKAATASSSGTAPPDVTSGSKRGLAPSTEPKPMPIVGATSVDKEIDGAHDPAEYLDAPGSANPTDNQIRECAYQCWVDRGSPEGHPELDWHEAQRKLRSASQRS
jgi:hypothetical protein